MEKIGPVEYAYIICRSCGTKNRVEEYSINQTPICGKCHEVLLPTKNTFQIKKIENKYIKKTILHYFAYVVAVSCFIGAVIVLTQYNPSTSGDVAKSVVPGVSNNKEFVPIQNRRLPNNTFLETKNLYGHGRFVVVNGTDRDAAIAIKGASFAYFYVASHSKASVDRLLNGDYKIQFQSGDDWDSSIGTFTRNASFQVFNSVARFASNVTYGEYSDSVNYDEYTITLHRVTGGNVTKSSVSKKDFERFLLSN